MCQFKFSDFFENVEILLDLFRDFPHKELATLFLKLKRGLCCSVRCCYCARSQRIVVCGVLDIYVA
jgi:hypothetical protein